MPETTSMTMIQAIRDALAVMMARDERVVSFGEDAGYFGGVFLHRGPQRSSATSAASTRRCPRTASSAPPSAWPERPAPGRRDPVPGLHLPGLRPDRQRGGEAALPLGRPVHRADGDPHALRRRHPRGALPRAVRRGLLLPHAGSQGGHPLDPLRRQGAADRLDPGPRPGAVPRAQGALPHASRKGSCPTGPLHGRLSTLRTRCARATTWSSSATARWSR